MAVLLELSEPLRFREGAGSLGERAAGRDNCDEGIAESAGIWERRAMSTLPRVMSELGGPREASMP